MLKKTKIKKGTKQVPMNYINYCIPSHLPLRNETGNWLSLKKKKKKTLKSPEVRNDGRAAELEPCLSTQFYKIMEKVHL